LTSASTVFLRQHVPNDNLMALPWIRKLVPFLLSMLVQSIDKARGSFEPAPDVVSDRLPVLAQFTAVQVTQPDRFRGANAGAAIPLFRIRQHRQTSRDRGYTGRGDPLATAAKQRRRTAKVAKKRDGSIPRVAAEFAAGSLETELSAIGKAVPAREWAKVPADYFANLDHYLHGAPKKK
jgi:hypothetical protein